MRVNYTTWGLVKLSLTSELTSFLSGPCNKNFLPIELDFFHEAKRVLRNNFDKKNSIKVLEFSEWFEINLEKNRK